MRRARATRCEVVRTFSPSSAGYVQDGRRFLAEIEPVIERLGIDRRHLIRSR